MRTSSRDVVVVAGNMVALSRMFVVSHHPLCEAGDQFVAMPDDLEWKIGSDQLVEPRVAKTPATSAQ